MSGPGQDLGRRLERLTGERVRAVALAGSQHRWEHYRVTLADGRPVFVKAASADLGGVFEAEAQGLRWLGEARAVPVPDVLGCDGATLAVSWVPSDAGGADAAERFGRDLAALHAAGADRFGTPWPGFIASLPLGGSVVAGGSAGAGAGTGDTAEPGEPWAGWYAAQRLEPYLRRAVDAGALGTAGARLVTGVIDRIGELAGPAEPPSRIHGDCWSGNLLWSGGRGWLIDPAAQGGHRESDLAMLALFGAPYLARILAAYQEVAPLAAGWQGRVPLHQLHPLLVHACLFGGTYADAVAEAAGSALSWAPVP